MNAKLKPLAVAVCMAAILLYWALTVEWKDFAATLGVRHEPELNAWPRIAWAYLVQFLFIAMSIVRGPFIVVLGWPLDAFLNWLMPKVENY